MGVTVTVEAVRRRGFPLSHTLKLRGYLVFGTGTTALAVAKFGG